MKQKVSISIEEGNLLKIKELLKNPKFRNTSHVIEFSLDKFLKEEESKDVGGENGKSI